MSWIVTATNERRKEALPLQSGHRFELKMVIWINLPRHRAQPVQHLPSTAHALDARKHHAAHQSGEQQPSLLEHREIRFAGVLAQHADTEIGICTKPVDT